MSTIPPSSHERIRQLIRLLGSDKSGEVVAAAAALSRTLAGTGNDFHDLANSLLPTELELQKKPHQAIAESCLKLNTAKNILKPHELKFINDMTKWNKPTEKQLEWLICLRTKLLK
jgi:hypothetical protein